MNPPLWLFLDSRANGGIESHVKLLAKGLKQSGWPVTIVLWQRYGKPHPMEPELAQLQLPLLTLNGNIISFYQAVKQHRPSVIHSHGYKAGLVAKLCKHYLGYALVTSFHAGEQATGRVALYDALDRASASWADCSITVSRAIAERIRSQTQFIKNFVEMPFLSEGSQSGKAIAFVGRLSEEKAPERFIHLAKRLPKQKFAIYGDGPMRAELMARSSANVTFYGMVTSMESYWHSISVLCMPSRFEGLPMAALEAMAHGIPVMAAPVGELPELIHHRKNGWLFKADDMQCWVKQLACWQLQSDEQQLAMASAARETVQKCYSTQSQLPQFQAIYQNII